MAKRKWLDQKYQLILNVLLAFAQYYQYEANENECLSDEVQSKSHQAFLPDLGQRILHE